MHLWELKEKIDNILFSQNNNFVSLECFSLETNTWL